MIPKAPFKCQNKDNSNNLQFDPGGMVVTNFLLMTLACRQLSMRTKLCIFNSNVKSVLLYGCEAWRTTQTMQQKIQTLPNTCLSRIYKIQWQAKILNEDLWERAGQEPVAKRILRRKWSWIGHSLRKPASSTTLQALTWNPQGKEKEAVLATVGGETLKQS